MPAVRRRKDCPVCKKEGLLKLSNHLTMVHNITGEKRKTLCHQAKSFPPVTKKVKTGRKRKICPLCKKPDLLLLSNHIRFVRNITGQGRKDLLKVAKAQLKKTRACSAEAAPLSSHVNQDKERSVDKSRQLTEDDFILKDISDRVQQYLCVSQERSLGSTTITEQTKLNGGNSPYIAKRRLETLNKQMDLDQDYSRIFFKEMDTTKQIQNLVENLIEDSLATRIHQYLKGMQRELQDSTNEIQEKKSEKVHQLSNDLEVSPAEEEKIVEERTINTVHQQLEEMEVSGMEEDVEKILQDNQSDGINYQLEDLEPDVASLDDSYDEKLALAAWNRKEFLGNKCEKRMQDLPSISDSLKEIFPDDVKDNMDSKQNRRRFSDELTEEISHVFAYYISKKITPPLGECRQFLMHQKPTEAQRSPKTIQDKVRSLISKGV